MTSGKNVVNLILFMDDDFLGRLIFKTGLYSRQAYIQDRLIFKTGLCAAVVQLLAAYTVLNMHTGIQHSCVLYMTSHTTNSIKSRFCKPRLLFESGICVGMQVQKCRFYPRATCIRERLLFKGGLYTRLYGICFLLAFVRLPRRSLFS